MDGNHHSNIRLVLWLNAGLFSALLLLFCYWNLTRETGFSAAVLLFQTLPLLALVPGMLKHAYRTYSWLCFVLLFYFIFAVQRVFLSNNHVSDYIFLVLVVCLFNTSMLASRWLQRLQKGLLSTTDQQSGTATPSQ